MQYDLDTKRMPSLQQLKARITEVVRRAPGVLSDPAPEVFVVETKPDVVKLRILWSTHDSRQHQMLGSYDQGLTAVADALDESGSSQRYPTAA